MSRRPSYVRITEIIYSLRLCRSTHIDLRWLDKPPPEYLVEHKPDGTIVLEPMTDTRYAVRPTDDGQVVLRKPIDAKANFVHVHYDLALEGQSDRFESGRRIRIVPWQNVKDEFPPGLKETGLSWELFAPDAVVIRYDDKICQVTKASLIPDDWDRSQFGLQARPKSVKDEEMRAQLGEDEWQKVLERRQRARQRKATPTVEAAEETP